VETSKLVQNLIHPFLFHLGRKYVKLILSFSFHDPYLSFSFDLRKTISNKDIQTKHVPQFKYLTFDTMVEFAEAYPDVFNYLPDKRDMYRIPRQFLINILTTKIGDPFDKWVKTQTDIRDNTMKIVHNLDIAVSNACLNAFNRSNHITSKNLK
jgi:hypothetical protein